MEKEIQKTVTKIIQSQENIEEEREVGIELDQNELRRLYIPSTHIQKCSKMFGSEEVVIKDVRKRESTIFSYCNILTSNETNIMIHFIITVKQRVLP